MKIVMILDQIQAGLGTKDDKMVELGGKKEPIGPGIMMKPNLAKVDGKVLASLYCGTGTFFEDKDEITRKVCAMLEKLSPDVVICGPAYNFLDYGKMAAEFATCIEKDTKFPVLCAMSEENEDTIAKYKDSITIVKMPKKGGFGLNQSLQNICDTAKAKAENTPINPEYKY